MSSLKFWHTLQFKLIVLLTVIFFVISTVLVIINFNLYRAELIKTLTHSAISLTQSIENSLEMAMITGNRDQMQQAIERIGSNEQIVNLFISDKTGTIRVSSDTSSIGNNLDISDPSCQTCHKRKTSKKVQSIIRKSQQGGRILRTMSLIYNREKCYSCHSPEHRINGVLFLDYSLKLHDEQFAIYKSRVALLGGIAILMLGSLTFIFLKKYVIQRVQKLVNRLESIGEGDLRESLKSSGNDEFAFLADSINTMSFKINESINKISEQRDYLQSVIDNVQDGLIVVDKNYRIVHANRVFLKLIGKKSMKVIGKSCCSALDYNFCGNLRERKKCPTVSVFAKGKFAQIKHKCQNENNDRIFEISASPLYDKSGSVSQSIELIRDITEKERLENELRQSEKLALMGRLSAGVAHEINNPLATISTCAEGLLSRFDESDQQDLQNVNWMRQYLKRIEKCVFRSKNIIDSLLAFSRRSEMIKKEIDLNQIIEDTLPMISHRIKKENKRLIKDLSSTPAKIKGEPTRLSQLILNLLLNSCDATTAGSEIKISTETNNNTTYLKISDTGKGIQKKDINRIFEPFYTTKEVGQGTGLGLAICQQIVKEHHGRIWVVSEPGRGSLFAISFPQIG